MNGFNVSESIQGQKRYCEEQGVPHFAPHSGRCWNCRKNIYEPSEQTRVLIWKEGHPTETYITGIKTEKAKSQLITGCPHCNRTYCD